MNNKRFSKTQSLIIVIIIYILAVAAGTVAYRMSGSFSPLWAWFIADAVATIIVWAAGLVLRNPSVYDPYWSVAPMVIVPLWIIERGSSLAAGDVLILAAFIFWGARLTYNWASGWRGLNHIDWRYEMLKQDNPALWPLTNFFGINMMPTVLVYLGMVPAYYFIMNKSGISLYSLLGFLICISAALLQMMSDAQMKRHRQSDMGGCIDTGLWQYSRHPNYFGEVMFWWGVFIMTLGTAAPLSRILGSMLISLLFVFISIPMMERHVTRRNPAYNDYKDKVSMLVPWKRKS